MSFRFSALILSGLLFLFFAGGVSNAAMESRLLGDTAKSLAWGPSLFRLLLAFHGALLIFAAIVWKWRLRNPANSSRPATPNEHRASDTSRFPWVILSVLSFLALGLRLWRLDSCLWYDEVLTLLDFVRPSLGEIITSFHSQNQHMLFTLLAHASISVFGESTWALRLPSVGFGVASVWALFLLGRRVIGTRETLLACVLLTFSYHHIWFSQNARGYMGLLFFAMLSTWLWLVALSRGAWRWWIYYALALSLGLWIHMTMVFVVAAHGVVYLILLIHPSWGIGRGESSWLEAGSRWKPLVSLLLAGSVTLQLYSLSLPEFLQTALHEVSLQSDWTNPLWVITESLRSLQIGFSGFAVVLLGGAMVIAGWLSLFRQKWIAGALMVLPGALGGLAMLALGHNLWPRFFFFSMGFALLISVRGAMVVPRLIFARISGLHSRERLARRAGMVLASLMIVASAMTVPRCYALPKQDFTGACDYVEQRRQPGDGVVAVGLAGIAYKRYFAPHWFAAMTTTELDTMRHAHSTLWLVYTLPIEVRAYHPEVWAAIENGFEPIKVFPGTLGGGEVVVCRNRPVE
jgi:hypothetical protein